MAGERDRQAPPDAKRRRRLYLSEALLLGPRALIAFGRQAGINRRVESAVEAGIDRALESPAVERAAVKVLDSDLVDRLWSRTLESEETQELVERIAQAPEVRAAIAYQGVGLLDDLRRNLGAAARRADSTVERPFRWLAREQPREGRMAFAGLVTRGLALALDAAIVNGVLLALSALVALIVSALFDDPDTAATVVAGTFAWVVGGSIYLVAFWSLTGQTPGMRFMGIGVAGADGTRLRPGRSLRRLFGMALAVATAMLGFAAAMFNDRRRGLHDRIADSVVVYVDPAALAVRR